MPFVRGPQNENVKFEDFYSKWRMTQRGHIEKLQEALQDGGPFDEDELSRLVEEVKGHYEFYYTTKTKADRQDVVRMLASSWRTPLEKALMWIGGWRPTMSFHLVYALTGQKEVLLKAASELEGVLSPSMEPLSLKQLENVVFLHHKTNISEESLSYRLAELQQSVGDEPMVSLAGAGIKNELVGNYVVNLEEGGPSTMEGAVDERLKQLEDILVEADELRRKTLQELLGVFLVVQAAQYLLGAAQLDMVITKLGQLKNVAA